MIPSWKDNFFIFWSFWLHVRMYRLIGQHLLTKWWEKLSLVKVLFNSRRTSIWITSVFSIFVEVRFQEFSVLQPAKGPFFDFLTYLGARIRRLILVNMTCVDQMFSKLIWRESSLQEEQKTYLNHAHISNTRGVTIQRILNATAR